MSRFSRIFIALFTGVLLALSSAPVHGQPYSYWLSIVPDRAGHEICVDPESRKLVMFGGVNETGYLCDSWAVEVKPGHYHWQPLVLSGLRPPGRKQTSMVYNSRRKSMIVFGGFGETYYNDVWELHLEGGDSYWDCLSVSGTPPSARDGHTAVYDPEGNRMVVFAGRTDPYNYLSDTWVLDFETMSWEELNISGPPVRANFEAVYDGNEHRMIIFGGETLNYIYYNDVWSLDLTEGGEVWTEIMDAGNVPHGRSSLCLEFDEDGNRLILFGGQWCDGYQFYYLDDLKILDLESCVWEAVYPGGIEPKIRRTAASSLLPFSDKTLLFVHGGGMAGGYYYGDAWVAVIE